MHIRNRIRELRYVKASELIPNERNWRTHPPAQLDALRGVLADVGIAGAAVAYETPEGLKLIDGHARAEVAPDAELPVLVLDVTEAEADKLLATFDPLSAMATTDTAKLEALLGDVKSNSEALTAMLGDLAQDNGIKAPDFQPVSIEEQGRLDETKPYNCPHCGEQFLLRDCQ